MEWVVETCTAVVDAEFADDAFVELAVDAMMHWEHPSMDWQQLNTNQQDYFQIVERH